MFLFLISATLLLHTAQSGVVHPHPHEIDESYLNLLIGVSTWDAPLTSSFVYAHKPPLSRSLCRIIKKKSLVVHCHLNITNVQSPKPDGSYACGTVKMIPLKSDLLGKWGQNSTDLFNTFSILHLMTWESLLYFHFIQQIQCISRK